MTASTFERTATTVLVASLGVLSFNLLTAQILFGIAALMWLRLVVAEGRIDVPPFFWALLAYAGLTIVSALLSFSRQPNDVRDFAGLIDLKQLVLFLMVPIVMRLARGAHAMTALNVIIAVGAAAAVLGVIEYAIFGFDNLDNRPLGSLTHYMTYSGIIMLVLTAAVARLLFYREQVVWPAVAVPALAVALAVTQTRNAWIGAAAAILCLLGAKRLRLMLIVPVVIGIALLAAPASLKNRALSTFDPNDPSNRDRVQMIQMGADMVRDHPWFGVGPEMVERVYGQYLRPNPVHTKNPHLHNVPMQIAAERGLLALGAWLVFVALAATGLARALRRGPAQALAGAGFGAIVALCAAGLFEYNFGDSEVLMLFLGLITLPYAARFGTASNTTARAADSGMS